MNNFLRCLDTYEEYDNYLKDVFGKESDIQYNKTLCEALLMSESDMPDEALLKFTSCIDLYYDQCGKVAAEPLLYKVLQLIRIASGCGASKEELAEEREKMLQKTLTLVSNY